MRNKIIGLVVALVILVTSVVIYVTVGNQPAEDTGVTENPQATPAATATPKNQLIEVTLADAKYVTIENYGQEPIQLGHVQTGSGDEVEHVYSLLSHKDVDFEETELSTLFSVITDLKGKKLGASATEGRTDEDFGFDEATKVTLELNDGTTYVVEVGDHTPAKDGTFARMAGTTDIYTLTYGEGLYLKSQLKDFKNTTLYYADSDTFISRIQMTKKGKLQYVIEGEILEGTEVQEWEVTAPVSWNLTYDSNFLTMTNQFYNIIAAYIVKDAATEDDFAKYGLTVPAYEIVFWDGTTENTLALGNLSSDDAYYYMRWNNGNEIYQISASQFTELDKSLEDMMSNLVYFVTYWDLSKFEVEYEGTNYVFEIGKNADHDTAKDVITYDGKKYSEATYPGVCAAFRNVYKACASLWGYEFDTSATPELKDPEITMIYHNREANEVMKVEYVRRDADRFYIFKNGKYTGALAQTDALYAASTDVSPGLDNVIPEFLNLVKAPK